MRIINVMSGKANDALDKVESPEDQLRLFIKQVEGEMAKLRDAVAIAIAAEKRLDGQVAVEMQKAAEWERKARYALQTGSEELARESLLRKEHCEELAAALKKDWGKQSEAVQKLKQSLTTTQQRAEKAKREYSLLLARYNSARAKKTLNEQLSKAEGTGSSGSNIESLKNKVQHAEAQAEAQAELNLADFSDGGDVEAQLNELEKKIRGDEALANLKAKLGKKD